MRGRERLGGQGGKRKGKRGFPRTAKSRWVVEGPSSRGGWRETRYAEVSLSLSLSLSLSRASRFVTLPLLALASSSASLVRWKHCTSLSFHRMISCYKLVDNVKKLCIVFDQIYLDDSSIIIKKKTLGNKDDIKENEFKRDLKCHNESSRWQGRMEWSHKQGKSNDDVCPFDMTHTQT